MLKIKNKQPKEIIILENEIWKDIYYPEAECYKELAESYMVSNMGRIYSKKSNQIVQSRAAGFNNYLRTPFYINGKGYKFATHRIVAFTFIKNDDPKNKTQVDHINIKTDDNRVENLCWISRSENTKKAREVSKIKLCQLDIKSFRILKIHNSVEEIIDYIKKNQKYINPSTKNIYGCFTLNGAFRTAYNFRWLRLDTVKENFKYLYDEYKKADKKELYKLEISAFKK